MIRRADWPERLYDYLDACRDRPFVWGSHDCATLAVGAVEAMTGVVLWEPRYRDARGAAHYMDKHPIEGVVDALLERIPPASAQRGDVVLLSLGRPTLGVCVGIEAAAPADLGLCTVPMSSAIAAWRV